MRRFRVHFIFPVLGMLLASVLAIQLEAESAMSSQMQSLVEADWVSRDGGASLTQTRLMLERAEKLLQRLQSKIELTAARHFEAELKALNVELRGLDAARGDARPNSSNVAEQPERVLYTRAHALARQIAFSNPLLRDLKQLLFITRHDAKGVFHMVDQFYGFNARPGGALLVLREPFGPAPKLIDLLENSVVQQGRLKGRKLMGGAFLSPEASFDGQTILFAWTEATGKDLEWSPSASYHIFRVKADGSGLVQLTDGYYNDFDPCFLPNGRVVFVSERRGGFLRCGRYCPTYTLFSMGADGSDMQCISFHETQEWQPSITEDGRIVYTRWDYIDRDTNMAHHPWTCRPDGADPRAMHGNYPARRESRPWMEMDVRAIPGTGKYVATAAAHHGHAFGSLVIIDPNVQDDGAASQLTRLTPEIPFPEAEKNLKPIAQCMVYGTPWPLSEDDFLCVYDPTTKNRGVYWMDRFGNKELIFRDPKISASSPMPLQRRVKPPVILPEGLAVADTAASTSPEAATIAIMNLYESDFTWPKETRISALRIIQLLPKSTPAPNEPRIGIAEQSNARAVLGTVPVEADGSAHFEAPPGKEIYFQALDEKGLAVQSMRSGTYVHAGERLLCQGCHEPRHQSPNRKMELPAALRRAPSKIKPDADGSNPFNYVRLVQPVLDQNCVSCHQEKKALDLTSVIEGKYGWHGKFFWSCNRLS